MRVDIRKKLDGKGAYIALALLMTMIIAFTVIAIVASVNSREEPETPPVLNTPEAPDDDAATGGEEIIEPDTDGDTGVDTEPEEQPIYLTPCVGYLQKDFSDTALVFSPTMKDHRVHLGIDIAGNLGDPVKAFCKGVVEKIFNDRFMGKTIVINHGNGLKSVYMNLAEALPDGIKEGCEIEAGTVIGAIGETASNECVDSPHLHFEVHLNDKETDPKNYITLPSSSESDGLYEG